MINKLSLHVTSVFTVKFVAREERVASRFGVEKLATLFKWVKGILTSLLTPLLLSHQREPKYPNLGVIMLLFFIPANEVMRSMLSAVPA